MTAEKTPVNPETQRRPHLVMTVGNLVIGDSRVEKSAISARDAGYKVTVVGVRRRSVQQVSFIDGNIPVIRVPIGHENHDRIAPALARHDAAIERRRKRINSLRQPWRRPAYLGHRVLVRGRDLRVRLSASLGLSWRRLWPHLLDYESAFFDALQALRPDLIHVHDRHPLPGVAAYVQWTKQTAGERPVRWVYDAHEFVRTQHLPPPREQQLAWIAAERDAIRGADAVVTVTEGIADLLQRSHSLAQRPAVVRNMPSTVQAAADSATSDVRSVLGMDTDVPLGVYAGGIAVQRGLETFIEAQSLVPNLHVAIVCNRDLERRSQLRQLARKLGTSERLHILDYVPASHVSRFLSTADFGVSALLPSAAHQEAAPTKVSEYLHGRLPVVVSDMRAQAERVRRIGFGEVYVSGDAASMANAIRKVLSDNAQYRARITDDLVAENSWEADLSHLTNAWLSLVPAGLEPIAQAAANVSVVNTLTQDTDSGWWSTIEQVSRFASVTSAAPKFEAIEGDLTDPTFVLTGDGQRFLEFWRQDVAAVRSVLYDTPFSLVDGWDPSLTTGILAMSGKPPVRLITGVEIFDIDRLRKTYPHHWLHDITDDEESRLRNDFSRLREEIRENDRMVISDVPMTVWSLNGVCTFVAPPLTLVLPELRRSDLPIRVGWLGSVRRSAAELESLRVLETQLGAPAIVTKIGATQLSDLSVLDVVIDGLSSDIPSPAGLQALAQGCALITGERPPHVEEKIGVERYDTLPRIGATPVSLADRLETLIKGSEFNTLRDQSRNFTLRNLTQEAAVNSLLDVLKIPLTNPSSN